MAKKFVKVGSMLRRKDGKGSFIVLGKEGSKKEQYNFDVKIAVRDSSGKVVAEVVNPILNLRDPRLGLPDEQAAKLPASLEAELSFVVEE